MEASYPMMQVIRSAVNNRVSLEDSNPVGTILMFAAATIPEKYLLCNGDSQHIATYPDLAALIANTFGSPPDSDHFLLPDFRDRLPRGAGATALGAASGSATAQLSADNIPAHSHSITDSGHSHGITDAGHSHTVNEPEDSNGNKGHQHSYTAPGGANTYNVSGGNQSCGTSGPSTGFSTTGVTIANQATGITINSQSTGITATNNSTGSGSAFSVVNPHIGINFIIKAVK